MRVLRGISLVGVLFIISMLQAYAVLTIEVNRGVDKPIPLAIVPFAGEQNVINQALPSGFSGVMKNDLVHSGRFSVLARAKLPQRPHSVKGFHLALWQKAKVNADYVLLGNIKAAKGGVNTVRFELFSLLSTKPVIGQVFHAVQTKNLRSLGHHISDLVYDAITGQKGYFSTRLAYVTVKNQGRSNPTYRLYISDQDGFNPRLLLSQVGIPIASPSWSSDGKRLAYVSYHNDRMVIYMITLATGQRNVVANFSGINSAPAFSPDDKTLAMALSRGQGAKTNIYSMQLRTGRLRQLTHIGTNTSPSYSPDGRSLYFVSDRGGSPQIYKLSLANRAVSRVSFYGVKNFRPRVMPNGKGIVLMHQAVSGGPIQIGVLNLATQDIRVVTSGVLDKSPSVSPNSLMIVYVNYNKQKGVLAEAGIDANVHLVLPESSGSVQSPAWSPYLS